MTSDAHVYALVESGLFKDAALELDQQGELPTHLKVLRAIRQRLHID